VIAKKEKIIINHMINRSMALNRNYALPGAEAMMGAESILTGCNLSAGPVFFVLFYFNYFYFYFVLLTQQNTMGELGSVESSFGGTSIFKQAGQIRREVQGALPSPATSEGESLNFLHSSKCCVYHCTAPGSFKTLIGAGVLLIGLGICFVRCCFFAWRAVCWNLIVLFLNSFRPPQAGLALTLREIRKFARKPPRPQHGQ
jgi:hypothetical protein